MSIEYDGCTVVRIMTDKGITEIGRFENHFRMPSNVVTLNDLLISMSGNYSDDSKAQVWNVVHSYNLDFTDFTITYEDEYMTGDSWTISGRKEAS